MLYHQMCIRDSTSHFFNITVSSLHIHHLTHSHLSTELSIWLLNLSLNSLHPHFFRFFRLLYTKFSSLRPKVLVSITGRPDRIRGRGFRSADTLSGTGRPGLWRQRPGRIADFGFVCHWAVEFRFGWLRMVEFGIGRLRIVEFGIGRLRIVEFGIGRLRTVRFWDHGSAKPPFFAEMPNQLPNFFWVRGARRGSSNLKKIFMRNEITLSFSSNMCYTICRMRT